MNFCSNKTNKSEDDEDFIIDDNFSSDYNEEFRTNSSSSSIKWSVDARKQNEVDWLSIERILYGEESLPEGISLLTLLLSIFYCISLFLSSQMIRRGKSFRVG